MGVPVSVSEVVSNPGGTGTTLAWTLPSHVEDDVLIVQGGWSGNQAPQTLAGWNLWFSQATGTASNGCGQGWWWRRVGVGETVANPTLTIGTTAVTRIGIAYCIRGADIDNPANTFWLKNQAVGNSTTPTPAGITTLAPNYLLLHGVTCRGNSAITPPTGYNEEQDAASGTTLAVNGSTKTQATAATVSGQAATISSNRWIAAIIAIPSPDYPYFRAQTSTTATATSVTGALPTGTSAADFYGRADVLVAVVKAAGNNIDITAQDAVNWTPVANWDIDTSTASDSIEIFTAKYAAGRNLQFNRPTSGVISVQLLAYRNAHQTDWIGNSSARQNSGSPAPFDALSRGFTKSTVLSVIVADADTNAVHTAPAGWTERGDGLGIGAADQIFEAGGSTTGASWTTTNAANVAGLIEMLSHAGAAASVTLERSVAAGATGAVTVAGVRIVERSCAVAATAAIAVNGYGPVLLTDNFDDNSRDTAKWTLGSIAFQNAAVGVAEANQQIEITPLVNESQPAIYGYQSANAYDFTGREASVRIAADIGSGTEAWLVVALDTDNYVRTWVAGGTLQTRSRVTTNSNQSHGAFDFATHTYWRIRHDEGADEIVWEYSANGDDWTELRRLTRPFAITSVSVYLSGGTGASVASPAQVKFDDFNLRTPPVPVRERSVSVAAVAEIAISGEAFSVFERSASVSASANIASDGHAVVERATTLSVTGTVTVAGARVVERSATLDASAVIESAGEAFTLFETSVSVSATASIESSAESFSIVEAAAVVTGVAAVVVAGVREVERSASLSVAAAIESSAESFTLLERAASVSATSSIETAATFFSVFERQVIFDAATTIVVNHQRELLRQVALSTTASITVAGQAGDEPVVHERSAAFSATGAITSAAEFFSIFTAAASLTSTATITASHQRALQRSVQLTTTGAISSSGAVVVEGIERATSFNATAVIAVSGQIHHPAPPRRIFMVESPQRTVAVPREFRSFKPSDRANGVIT